MKGLFQDCLNIYMTSRNKSQNFPEQNQLKLVWYNL